MKSRALATRRPVVRRQAIAASIETVSNAAAQMVLVPTVAQLFTDAPVAASSSAAAPAAVTLEVGEDAALAAAVQRQASLFLASLQGKQRHDFWQLQKYAHGLVKHRPERDEDDPSTVDRQSNQTRQPQRRGARAQADAVVAVEETAAVVAPAKRRGGIFTQDDEIWND